MRANRFKRLWLSALLLLAGCPGVHEDTSSQGSAQPAASPSPVAIETIRDWKLSAQGDWQLAAALAQRRGPLWSLQGLHWQGHGVEILSPRAREVAPQHFELSELSLQAAGLSAQAPAATLDLGGRQLAGAQLVLKGRSWQLEAQSFKSGLPLKHWQLQKVKARFERP